MIKNYFLLTLLYFPLIYAEIELVQLEWDVPFCDDGCAKLTQRYLEKIPEVAEVVVKKAAGQARLRWKPNVKYDYKPVNVAIHAAGPSVHQVRLVVRGTLEEKNDEWFLVSLGDNSRFRLLSVIHPNPREYNIRHSPYNRRLSKELREQLTKAKDEFRVVTITGPILRFYQFNPVDLIIENVKVWGLSDIK